MARYCCPLDFQTPTTGLVSGGGCVVEITNDTWDGLAGSWPLNEDGDGTAGEFKDRTRNHLHATGGNGSDPTVVPVLDEGVFCQNSQRFDGRQFITVPPDRVGIDQGFSASYWIRIGTFYTPRAGFSRGHVTPDGDQWVFSLGHSFLNQIQASIQTYATDGTRTTYTMNGSTMLSQDQFYHFGASWGPSVGLKLYVNGVLDGTLAVPQAYVQPLTNAGYFSRYNLGGYVTGNLQDIRLHPVTRPAAWFLAEYQNYCLPGFFSVGYEEG